MPKTPLLALSRRPVLITLAVFALAIALALLAANTDLQGNKSLDVTGLDVVVGLAFIGGAVVAQGPWRARSLFGAVGFAWLLGSVVPAAMLDYAGVLAIALLTFPSGRPSGSWQWLLVASALVAILAMSFDPVLAALFGAVAATAVFGRRWERAASFFPATAAGAVSLLLAAHAVVEQRQAAKFDQGMWLLGVEALLLLIAAGFPLAARAVARERALLADRLLAEDRPAGLDGLAAVLGATLREPNLRVLRWDGRAGSYIAPDGRAATLVSVASVLAVNDGQERLAVVTHDRPAAMQDPVVARSVAEAVRLAALNERWQTALQTQIGELEAARGRVLAATDRQRAQIAARLVTEVVRPVQAALADLDAVGAKGASGPAATGGFDAQDAEDALRVARDELAASINEVLALTDGLPPTGLGHGGLIDALRRLAERCPIPVALTLAPDAAADADRETALFYVCSEALANTIKHARASHVSIDLRRDPAGLSLVFADDGIGGAEPGGFGLRGLADRLATFGGRLRVDSPPGAGTTLTVRVAV
jgi:hypothetical protein